MIYTRQLYINKLKYLVLILKLKTNVVAHGISHRDIFALKYGKPSRKCSFY